MRHAWVSISLRLHPMETPSTLLANCERNPLIFAKGPVVQLVRWLIIWVQGEVVIFWEISYSNLHQSRAKYLRKAVSWNCSWLDWCLESVNLCWTGILHLGLVTHICVMNNSPHFFSDTYACTTNSSISPITPGGRPRKQCQAKKS